MAIKEMLLPEFDQEMATTRKLLERVPEDKPEWRPHAKSMTLARLAGHLSEMPSWATMTLTQDSIDLNPPGGSSFAPAVMKSRQELLKSFDGNVQAAREALAGGQDPDFMKPWSLLRGGQTLFTMPKVAVLRSFVISHMIHHRAQLGVYLRMNDVPLPQSYGPTADETAM